jgi:hypothetical protein
MLLFVHVSIFLKLIAFSLSDISLLLLSKKYNRLQLHMDLRCIVHLYLFPINILHVYWINLCVCHMVYVLETMLVFAKCIVMQEGKYFHLVVSLKRIHQIFFCYLSPCQQVFKIFTLLFEKGFVYVHFHSMVITLLCISFEVSEFEINKLGDLFSYMFICVYVFM